MFRRLVIGNGVEPGRCTATIVRWFGCPTTLQEAKPKAGSPRRPNVRWRGGPQTGIEAQKSTPSASPVDRSSQIRVITNGRSVTPTKINRGGSRGTNDTWARTGRNVGATSTTVCSRSARHGEANVACPPECREQTCEGPKEPHERRRTATKREREDLRRPARLCELATGSGTPREEGAIWRMTRSGRRNPGEGARVVRVARERDDIK
jgi:hypothetical protein